MDKFSRRLSIIILAFIIGISTVWGWSYYLDSQKTRIIAPEARWERIYFETINEATNLGELEELRDVALKSDDIEIRVWRGFGATGLEGVILERKDDKWSAAHIEIGHNANSGTRKLMEFRDLNSPETGWESFWKQLDEKGIMTLPDPTDESCSYGWIDANSYVVEINYNKIYRTYKYPDGIKGCGDNAKRMEEIGEIIGSEFDSGAEQCKAAEWFGCSEIRRKRRQENR
jgi:hypothetical protein